MCGYTRYRREFIAFVNEVDPDDPSGQTRFRLGCESIYEAVRSGDPHAQKLFLEQAAGKGVSPLAIAEHFRQVERDRIDLALRLLGDRVVGMEPSKLREFLAACARDPRGFLQAAEEWCSSQGQPQTQTPQAELPPQPEDKDAP